MLLPEQRKSAMLLRALAGALLLHLVSHSLGQIADSRGTVLVLHGDTALSTDYGEYLEHVRRLGYTVEERQAGDKGLQLRKWDDWLYAKLIIFASGVTGTRSRSPLPLGLIVLCTPPEYFKG